MDKDDEVAFTLYLVVHSSMVRYIHKLYHQIGLSNGANLERLEWRFQANKIKLDYSSDSIYYYANIWK